jgi:hypothetical protein
MKLDRTQSGRRLRIVSLGVALLAFAAHAQQAEATYFQFSNLFTVNGGALPVTHNIQNNTTATVTFETDPGDPNAPDIIVTSVNSGPPGDNYDANLPDGTDIIISYISVPVSSLTTGQTVSIPYTFSLTIDDYLTPTGVTLNGSHTFSIDGLLTGTVGAGKKVNLSTNVYSGTNVLSAIFGTAPMLYTLSYNAYTAPGPGNDGAFGFHVTAVPVPEPAAWAIMALGTLGLATPAFRRWRRKRQCPGSST